MAGKNSTFVNNSAPSVDDVWLNLTQSETNNIIEGSGQTLSDAIDNQSAIGMARFAANNFYIDSGSADNYILTLASSFTSPVSATDGYFIGMEIKFRAGNAGTGGAAIVNVGGAGAVSLKEADGTTNPVSIPTTEDSVFRYDGTVFRRANLAIATQAQTIAGQANKIIDAANLLSVFNSSSRDTNGYARLPLNVGSSILEIIVQWGSDSITSGGSVTYPLAFPNAILFGMAQHTGATSSTNSNTKTTSQITIHHGVGGSQLMNWLVIGY